MTFALRNTNLIGPTCYHLPLCYAETVWEGSVGGDLVSHRLSIFERDAVS